MLDNLSDAEKAMLLMATGSQAGNAISNLGRAARGRPEMTGGNRMLPVVGQIASRQHAEKKREEMIAALSQGGNLTPQQEAIVNAAPGAAATVLASAAFDPKTARRYTPVGNRMWDNEAATYIDPPNTGSPKWVDRQEGSENVTYAVYPDGREVEIARGPKWNPKSGSGSGGGGGGSGGGYFAGGGPQGRGVEAWAINVQRTVEGKLNRGEPITPEEQADLNAAHYALSLQRTADGDVINIPPKPLYPQGPRPTSRPAAVVDKGVQLAGNQQAGVDQVAPQGGPEVIYSSKNLSDSARKQVATLQKEYGALEMKLSDVDEAIRLFDPTFVGPEGWVNRSKEWVVSALTRGSASEPARKFHKIMKTLQATNWRELVGSGQLSKGDYQFLEKIISSGEFWSSSGDVTSSLTRLRRILVNGMAATNQMASAYGATYRGDLADAPDAPAPAANPALPKQGLMQPAGVSGQEIDRNTDPSTWPVGGVLDGRKLVGDPYSEEGWQ